MADHTFDPEAPSFNLPRAPSEPTECEEKKTEDSRPDTGKFHVEAPEYQPRYNIAAEEFKLPSEEPEVDTRSTLEHSSKAFEGIVRNFAVLINELLLTLDVREQKWRTISGITTNVNCVGYRYAAALFIPADNQLFFCGGRNSEGISDLAWVVDVKRRSGQYVDNSRYIQPLLSPRIMHSLVYYRGKPYVIGGQSDRDTYLNNVECWNDERWEIVDDLKRPRSTFAAVTTESAIYVFGGYSGSSQIEPSIEKFTEDTEEWALLQVELSMLAGCGAVKRCSSILILGGADSEGAKKCVFRLDTETDSLTTESYELNHPRVRPIVFVVNQDVFVVGGSRTDTEVFMGNKFTPWISAPKAISADHLMAMPYVIDSNRE